jgi:hypothetical protein
MREPLDSELSFVLPKRMPQTIARHQKLFEEAQDMKDFKCCRAYTTPAVSNDSQELHFASLSLHWT